MPHLIFRSPFEAIRLVSIHPFPTFQSDLWTGNLLVVKRWPVELSLAGFSRKKTSEVYFCWMRFVLLWMVDLETPHITSMSRKEVTRWFRKYENVAICNLIFPQFCEWGQMELKGHNWYKWSKKVGCMSHMASGCRIYPFTGAVLDHEKVSVSLLRLSIRPLLAMDFLGLVSQMMPVLDTYLSEIDMLWLLVSFSLEAWDLSESLSFVIVMSQWD